MFQISRLGSLGPTLFGSSRTPTALPASLRRDAQRQLSLDRLGDQLRTLRRGLEHLGRDRAATSDRVGARDAAAGSAVSAPVLGTALTHATLRSSAEVNETSTSFTPVAPPVSGTTTTQPIVSGTYDGLDGDDTLLFEFRKDATVGSTDRNRVLVRRGDGTVIKNLNFRYVPAGVARPIGNGLSLALGAGTTDKGDTFSVDVSASVGTSVDPSKPFDGQGAEDPRFDAGQAVAAGSFDVNGVNIQVDADDTVDGVLAKITASAADVDAVYDAAGDRVVLTRRTPGPASTIVLGGDTSGFLAATKLATATVQPGAQVESYRQAISSVAAFGSVVTGSFTVNGQSISVDPGVDSLEDVVGRIHQSSAGVTASYDASTKRLGITGNGLSDDLVLASDSSGLLAALGIASGTHGAVSARRGERVESFESARAVRREIGALGRVVNDIFRGRFPGFDPGEITGLRGGLEEALSNVFEELLDGGGARLRSGFGIDLDRSSRRAGDLLHLDLRRFDRAAREDFGELRAFLFGSEDERGSRSASRPGPEGGLVPALLSAVEAVQTQVAVKLGLDPSSGQRIDLRI